MIKTNNLKSKKIRFFLGSIYLTVFCLSFSIFSYFFEQFFLNIFYGLITSLTFLLLVRIEDVELNSNSIFLTTSIFLGLVKTNEKISLDNIKSIRQTSDQFSNERGWFLFNRKKLNVLELITNKDEVFRLNTSNYNVDILQLKKQIEELMNR